MSDSYLDYWQVREPIFTTPVGKEHMYCSQAMQLIRQQLLAYFSKPGSLTLVTAAAGFGKSTLAKWVYDSLSFAQWEVLLINLIRDHQKEGWLLQHMADFFGVKGVEPASLSSAIMAKLDEVASEQRRLLVLIDSAERLKTAEAFNEIHAILSMQKMGRPCLSFLLLGREELRGVLTQSPEIAALVTRNFRLPGLGANEIQDFIGQKIKNVGMKPNPFTVDAMNAIYAKSGGQFAKIVHLAESCLIDAFINRMKTIDARLVENADALEVRHKLDANLSDFQISNHSQAPKQDDNLTLDALLKKSS